MYRQKLRNYLYIVSIVVLLIFLGSITPIVFNFDEYFNVGYFNISKNYRTTYSDGYGELNMELELDRFRDDRYYYYVSCHFSTGSSVQVVGLRYLNYTVFLSGSIVTNQIFDIDPPTEQFARTSSVRMERGQTLVWNGMAEVQFISNSILQNETIRFDLRLGMYFGAEEYYNLGLISYVVFFFWIMAFPLCPMILKAIIQPNFRAPLDEEMKKKQTKYLDYFKKPEDDQS